MPRKLIPEEIFRARRNAQLRKAEEELCAELKDLYGENDIEDVLEGIPVLAVIPVIPEPPDLPAIDELCAEFLKENMELDRWIKSALAAIDKGDEDERL